MMSCSKALSVAAICALTMSTSAVADEAAESILDQAMPFMHHSCESVLGTYQDDHQQIADIVALMVMVSLYNREIDILAEVEDESDRDALDVEFVEELEQACDDDPGLLLAAAVDTAVVRTLAAFD